MIMAETQNVQPVLQQVQATGKWKNWLLLLFAGIIVLLLLGKKNPESIRQVTVIVGLVVGGVLLYFAVQWYFRLKKYEDVPKMIKKCREELAKSGLVVNSRVENVEVVPVGQNLFYVYFKSNSVGILRNPMIGSVGLSVRKPFELRADYENSRINELLREGKIVLQKPLEEE